VALPVFAVVEIYLCLQDVKSQAPLHSFVILTVIVILLSPIVYVLFVIVLLLETFSIRSTLVIGLAGIELRHRALRKELNEKVVNGNVPLGTASAASPYDSTLLVKCISGEIHRGGSIFFGRPHLFARLTLGDQVFETSSKELSVSSLKPHWLQERKFRLRHGDDMLMRIHVIDKVRTAFCEYETAGVISSSFAAIHCVLCCGERRCSGGRTE